MKALLMKNLTPTWLSDIKLVGWDVDGTLYPFNLDLNQVIEQEKMMSVAMALGVSVEHAQTEVDEAYQRLKSHTRVLNEFGIDGEQFFVDLWQRLDLQPFIKPNPQLAKALLNIQKQSNLQQALITNSNTLATVTKKLSLIGISPEVFSHIYTSVDTGFIKPDPKIFEMVLKDFGLKPEEMLYIGDREETDIKPAHQMGIRTALVTNEMGKTVSTVADLHVASSVEIASLLL